MSSTKDVVQRYVELTNEPGSPSFDLFGEQVDWCEVHSGRAGGKQALFAAMRESRQMFDAVRLDVKSLIVDGEAASLEAVWSGRMIANDVRVSVPMVYIFGVRDGRIVKEADYVVMPSQA
jgi:hypothetical protein